VTTRQFGRVIVRVNVATCEARFTAASRSYVAEMDAGQRNEVTRWVIEVFEASGWRVPDPMAVRDRLWA
jgi:hypothetical protein